MSHVALQTCVDRYVLSYIHMYICLYICTCIYIYISLCNMYMYIYVMIANTQGIDGMISDVLQAPACGG